MSRITGQVQISAPAEKVWQVLADFGGVARWAPNVVDCRCTTEITRGVGAKRILTTSRGDITQKVVVAWHEGRSYTFEIPEGLAAIIRVLRETWSVENTSAGTYVVVLMNYQRKAGLIYAILDSLVARRVLSKMLVENLAGLKKHVESE